MTKNLVFFAILLFSLSSFSADQYILVVFHGKGLSENEDFKERSTVPGNLDKTKILKVYDATHNIKDKKFPQVLANFQCQNKTQIRKDLGLLIIGYSWGTKAAYDFAKDYFGKCGRKADRAYIIDGILKPAMPFPIAPIATVCKNYYKTIHPIRGAPFKNCENFDKTQFCTQLGGEYAKGFKCHQLIIQSGLEMAIKDIAEGLK